MSAIASTLRRYWVELAWGAFAAVNLAVMFRLDLGQTVPFHFVWVSLTLVYGYRVWGPRATAAVCLAVCTLTSAAFLRPITKGIVNPDEMAENAVGATGHGDRILLRAGCEDDDAVIEVIDDGTGISPGHLDRVFDRFWRINGNGGHDNGGTGLGLAIVKAIVEAHGGTVSVASTLGQGTTFTMRLPGFQASQHTPPFHLVDDRAARDADSGRGHGARSI
jgi:hypothetical protein